MSGFQIPDLPGFELTGELRPPREGEWYWTGASASFEAGQGWLDTGHSQRLILRKLRSENLADYELTGEHRHAEADEPWLCSSHAGRSAVCFGSTPDGQRKHILRERGQS